MSFKFDPNSTENEGRFRLIDPKSFDSKTYRRWSKWGKKKLPKGITIVVGHHKKEDRLLPQTIRFNKEIWTAAKAKEWWTKTGKEIFGKYKTWTQKDWEKKSFSEQLLKIARLLCADYPKHPDKKIIRKNEFYNKGLTEADIWNWYDKNKRKILPYLQDREVLTVIKTDEGTIIKRNDKNGKPIRVKTLEDFENLNNGRNVEFHMVVGKKSDLAWVDLDPGKNFDFKEVQKVAKDLKSKLKSLPFVKNTFLKYSGGRGFHIMMALKKEGPVDKTREELKEYLQSYIETTGNDKLVLKKLKPSEMRLDISTFHDKGSIRAPYSLNANTGLASLFVLNKSQAKI